MNLTLGTSLSLPSVSQHNSKALLQSTSLSHISDLLLTYLFIETENVQVLRSSSYLSRLEVKWHVLGNLGHVFCALNNLFAPTDTSKYSIHWIFEEKGMAQDLAEKGNWNEDYSRHFILFYFSKEKYERKSYYYYLRKQSRNAAMERKTQRKEREREGNNNLLNIKGINHWTTKGTQTKRKCVRKHKNQTKKQGKKKQNKNGNEWGKTNGNSWIMHHLISFFPFGNNNHWKKFSGTKGRHLHFYI